MKIVLLVMCVLLVACTNPTEETNTTAAAIKTTTTVPATTSTSTTSPAPPSTHPGSGVWGWADWAWEYDPNPPDCTVLDDDCTPDLVDEVGGGFAVTITEREGGPTFASYEGTWGEIHLPVAIGQQSAMDCEALADDISLSKASLRSVLDLDDPSAVVEQATFLAHGIALYHEQCGALPEPVVDCDQLLTDMPVTVGLVRGNIPDAALSGDTRGEDPDLDAYADAATELADVWTSYEASCGDLPADYVAEWGDDVVGGS